MHDGSRHDDTPDTKHSTPTPCLPTHSTPSIATQAFCFYTAQQQHARVRILIAPFHCHRSHHTALATHIAIAIPFTFTVRQSEESHCCKQFELSSQIETSVRHDSPRATQTKQHKSALPFDTITIRIHSIFKKKKNDSFHLQTNQFLEYLLFINQRPK